MFKDTKLYSILSNKCPHCHKGPFFKGKHPYDFSKLGKMYDHCVVCNEDFEKEGAALEALLAKNGK